MDKKETSFLSIDEELAASFADMKDDGADNADINEEIDPSVNDDVDIEEDEPTEQAKPTEPVKQDVKPEGAPSKPTPKTDDEKKAEAAEFYRLRKEAAEAKRLAIEAEQKQKENDDLLAKLAKQAGYNDPNQFKEMAMQELTKKEAEAAGIPPEVYKQLKGLETKLAQMEAQKLQEAQEQSAQRFTSALDKFVKDFELGDAGKDKVFARLAEAGYQDVADILAFKNPELLIKGVMTDVIESHALAKHLKTTNSRSKVDSERIETGDKVEVNSWEDILSKDLEVYKRDNGL